MLLQKARFLEYEAECIPDWLEADETPSNLVRSDLHDVDLTGDSFTGLTSVAFEGSVQEETYCRTPIPAPLQSFAIA